MLSDPLISNMMFNPYSWVILWLREGHNARKTMKQHMDFFHFHICCRACLKTPKSLKKFFAEKNFLWKNFFLSFFLRKVANNIFSKSFKNDARGIIRKRNVFKKNCHNFKVIWGHLRSSEVLQNYQALTVALLKWAESGLLSSESASRLSRAW